MKKISHHWRMETDRHKTEDEYGMHVKRYLTHEGISFDKLKELLFLQLYRQLCLH